MRQATLGETDVYDPLTEYMRSDPGPDPDEVIRELETTRRSLLDRVASEGNPLSREYHMERADVLGDVIEQIEAGASVDEARRHANITANRGAKEMEKHGLDTRERALTKGRKSGGEQAAQIIEEMQ